MLDSTKYRITLAFIKKPHKKDIMYFIKLLTVFFYSIFAQVVVEIAERGSE